MANIRIVHTNHIDPAPEAAVAPTMTCVDNAAATAADSTQIANLRNPARDKVCTITGTSPYTFKISWGGEERKIGMLGLFRHTLAGGSIRAYGYSDAAWTTQTYDSTSQTINPPIAIGSHTWGLDPSSDYDDDRLLAEAPYVLWFTPALFKSFKVVVTSSASVKQISRMWLGAYYEFATQPALGAGVGWASNTSHSRMEGGSLRSNKGRRWRRMDLDLAYMTDNERAIMLDLVGLTTGRDVVLSVFPEAGGRAERDYTINGKSVSDDPIVYANYSWRSKKVVIEEC